MAAFFSFSGCKTAGQKQECFDNSHCSNTQMCVRGKCVPKE
jgi:hypothetical protein